jgi:hypothetical protein
MRRPVILIAALIVLGGGLSSIGCSQSEGESGVRTGSGGEAGAGQAATDKGGSVGPMALQRQTDSINLMIGQSAWPVPGGGVTVTQGLDVAADGKIAVRVRQCPPPAESDGALLKACLGAPSGGLDAVVQFSPIEIDGSSIGIQSAGGRFVVIFSCRSSEACLASPDGVFQLRSFGLACPDQGECNRLVIAFSSLLDTMGASGAR